MFFIGEDPLAVHSLTANATSLCNDLLKSRGKDFVTHGFIMGILYTAHDYVRGTLPAEEIEMAQNIEKSNPEIFEAFRNDESLTPAAFESKSSLPAHEIASFWRHQRKVWNFLKHANRDAESHISETCIDNAHDIGTAVATYINVFDEPFEEMFAFVCWQHFYGNNRHYEYGWQYEPYHTYFSELDEPTAKIACFMWLSLAERGSDFVNALYGGVDAMKDKEIQKQFMSNLDKDSS